MENEMPKPQEGVNVFNLGLDVGRLIARYELEIERLKMELAALKEKKAI